MEFETDRLLLRPLASTDLPHLQRYATRPEFYRYLPIPKQTAETVAIFLQTQLDLQKHDHGKRLTFAIEPKEIHHIVGTIRIEVQSVENRSGDVGYALDSDFQRRGYMTEALKRILALGFGTLNLHRIWATADVDNERSWNLLERVGMIREGILREHLKMRGQWRSSYLYSILEPDR